MGFGGLFRGFVPAFDPGGAVVPWYLSGGIAAANCLAAYTPKGAASLAASYDNNAAPGNGLPDGTYDAALGVAPTFDPLTGWTFDGLTQYLMTGITPAVTWSAICRYSNATGVGGYILFGSGYATNGFHFYPNFTGSSYWRNGASYSGSAAGHTSGVVAIVGKSAYHDGTLHGTMGAGSPPSAAIYVGGSNSTPAYFCPCKIQAFAIYNTTLTDVATIAAAMAAL